MIGARSRSERIVQALTIGYGYTVVVSVTGLILTPVFLAKLGVDDYGLWLMVGQVLALISLLDLGVSAIVPREVARASGTQDRDAIADVFVRARWLVWLQTPVAAVAALIAWFVVAAAHPGIQGPLTVILATFVVQFPLRIAAAVLNGLQDISYCAIVQAVCWAATTAISVALVFAGWGLYSLAVGWAAGQLLGCALSWLRLRTLLPARSRHTGWPGRNRMWSLLQSSLWTSLSQIAHLLVAGTNLLILTWVIGPRATVIFSCTSKLAALLGMQCTIIGVTAQPALAQLRATGDTERLRQALRAIGLLVMVASGAVVVAVAAVNEAFVVRWVGPDQFGGPLLSLLILAGMMVRHLAFTWWNAAFILGFERRVATFAIADGIVTVVATIAWSAGIGIAGAALGSLTGVVLVYGPAGLATVSAAVGVAPLRTLAWIAPWAIRFAIIAGPIAVLSMTDLAESALTATGIFAAGTIAYAVSMYLMTSHGPLREYRDRVMAMVRRGLGRRNPN